MATKTYKVEKYDGKKEKWIDYGKGYTEQDVKDITKGYIVDKEMTEMFSQTVYTRKNTITMFLVTEMA